MPCFLVDLPICTRKGPHQAAFLKQHISLQPLQASQGESKESLSSALADRWADSLDAYGLRLCMRAELEITHPHSLCLFLRHFSLGRHHAPHLPTVPGLLSGRKGWRESICDLNTALTSALHKSWSWTHSPSLETMLVLKVHMPPPEHLFSLMAFRIVSWVYISEVMWQPENLRFRKSIFLNILFPGNGSKPWTL